MLLRELLRFLRDRNFVLSGLQLSIHNFLLFLRFYDLAHKLQMIAVQRFKRFLDHTTLFSREIQLVALPDEAMLICNNFVTFCDKVLAIIQPKDSHHKNLEVINEHLIFLTSQRKEAEPHFVNKVGLAAILRGLLFR